MPIVSYPQTLFGTRTWRDSINPVFWSMLFKLDLLPFAGNAASDPRDPIYNLLSKFYWFIRLSHRDIDRLSRLPRSQSLRGKVTKHPRTDEPWIWGRESNTASPFNESTTFQAFALCYCIPLIRFGIMTLQALWCALRIMLMNPFLSSSEGYYSRYVFY